MEDFRRRIVVASAAGLSTIAAEMDVVTADGKTHSLSTHAARGSAANPLKDSEIEEKLRIEAASWKPGHDVQPLIDAVWSVDTSDDVSRLAALAI